MKSVRLAIASAVLCIASFGAMAALSQGQLTALKTAIFADPALVTLVNSGQYGEIAARMNLPSNPSASVWRTDCSVYGIIDAINWSLYTPSDTPDGTQIWTNRILSVQTKQMNLQLMLTGRLTLDASKANVRAGIRDAVIQIPSGSGGAQVSPGGASGVTVLTACTRQGTRGELVLKSSDATTGSVTASVLGFEGTLTERDVEDALVRG